MRKINFVSSRQKSLSKKQLKDRRYFYIAVAVFAIVVFLAVLVLLVQWYFISRVKKITTESETLQNQILAGADKENTFIVLVQKLAAITTVMGDRERRKEAVDYFSSIFGNEVLVEEMSYEEDQQKQLLIFKLVSKNVFVLKGVMQQLQSPELRSKYPSIKLSDLIRSDRADYSLDVVVPLSEGS